MRTSLTFLGTLLLAALLQAAEAAAPEGEEIAKYWPAALDFTMETLGGDEVHLAEKYQGQVVLLVNVASKCGFTPQYKGLQALHEKYADEGLAIVGVPCNQFGGQEPGDADEISKYCEKNYGVEFDLLAKVNVRRSEEDQCDLYRLLTDPEAYPEPGSDIQWNFEKFLLNRQGEVLRHFRSKVLPESEELTSAITSALSEPAPEELEAE